MNHEPDVWFKHNADSISEPHMRRIRAKFGKLQGYAMYYLTTEIMIKSGGYISIEDIDAYADDYELSASALLGFFDYCVEIGLFTLDDNAYSSYVAVHTCQKRKAISEVRAESGRLGGMAKNKNKEDEPVPVPEQESKHTKDKPQKEPVPESEEIQQLRGYVAAIYADFPNAKNKAKLTTEEYQKLLDKWGYDLLVEMQREYYEWLSIQGKKRTSTDYGTLLKGGWVLDKCNNPKGTTLKPSNQTQSRIDLLNTSEGKW